MRERDNEIKTVVSSNHCIVYRYRLNVSYQFWLASIRDGSFTFCGHCVCFQTGVAGFPVAGILVLLIFLLLWPQIICLV